MFPLIQSSFLWFLMMSDSHMKQKKKMDWKIYKVEKGQKGNGKKFTRHGKGNKKPKQSSAKLINKIVTSPFLSLCNLLSLLYNFVFCSFFPDCFLKNVDFPALSLISLCNKDFVSTMTFFLLRRYYSISGSDKKGIQVATMPVRRTLTYYLILSW